MPAAAQVKAPVPYPDPNKLDVGGLEVKKQPIDQIVTYKALPAYKQAPWLDKFVADGTLPPVEKRLPKEPQVYLTSGMKDGIGVYGDLWRGFSACPTAGYNNMAGTTMGWFGIESYTVRYQAAGQDRPAVPRRPGHRTHARSRQELGMVGGWQTTDHAPDRRRQVVGWRAVQR